MPGAVYRDTDEILFRANKNEGKAREEKKEKKNFTGIVPGDEVIPTIIRPKHLEAIREGNSVRSGLARPGEEIGIGISRVLSFFWRALNRSRIKP